MHQRCGFPWILLKNSKVMVLAKDRIAMQLFFVILEYLDKVDNNNITEQL